MECLVQLKPVSLRWANEDAHRLVVLEEAEGVAGFSGKLGRWW